MGALRQVAAAGVTAVLGLVISVALGALLFASDPAVASVGVGVALLSTAVIATVQALRGAVPGTMAGIQDSPTILLSIAVGSVTAAGAGLSPERRLATSLAVVAVAAIATGGIIYLIGRLRLGSLLRFMPYPVIGGFLAGTGWLLLTGAVDVLTGLPVRLDTLGELLGGATALRWVPSVLIAALLLWTAERHPHPLLLPGGLLGLTVGFYGLWLALGGTLQEALDEGWLLGPFPDAGRWLPDPLEVLTGAEWGLVVGEVSTLAGVALVVVVSVVLTTSGLEVAMDTEVDVDKELRAGGLANLLSGVAGGSLGYPWLSVTVLGRTLGAHGRTGGLVLGGTAAAALLLGTAPLAWFPRPVLGVILALLGWSFLHEWVVRAWARMPRAEYAIVASILAVIAVFGFLRGVAFGIILAIVLFVVAVSRIDVVKHELSGLDRASQVDRSGAEQEVLREARRHVRILVVQGYLFFGTAHGVGQRLVRRVEDRAAPPLRFAILDLRLVTGVDSSAVFALSRLLRRLSASGAVLVLSNVPAGALRALRAGGVLDVAGVEVMPDLDHALEWCEDQLLAEWPRKVDVSDVRTAVASLLPGDVDPAVLLARMTVRQFPAGTRLITEGEPSGGMSVIVRGMLEVVRTSAAGSTVRLRVLRPGAVTGEMSMYLGTPASASVVASTEVTVVHLSEEAFAELEEADPEAARALHRTLARAIAGRLAESNRAVEALLD